MKRQTLILMALVGLFSIARATSLLDGLVTRYDFNGSLIDGTGNGHDLTGGGDYEYIQDRFGVYDGAVNLITANPANGTFFLGTGPNLANKSSSVSFWVKKDPQTPGSWVFGLGHPAGTGGSGGQDMHVALNYGAAIRYSFFYDDFDISAPLVSNAWNHLAFTFDYGTNQRSIYLNGLLEATNTAASPFSGGNALKMGFEGIGLDDFRFYDRVLTGQEVKMLAVGANVPDGGHVAAFMASALAVMALLRRRLSCAA